MCIQLPWITCARADFQGPQEHHILGQIQLVSEKSSLWLDFRSRAPGFGFQFQASV